MRIGLDGIPLTEPKAGIGHYTAELAAALARQSPADDFELILPDRFDLAADPAAPDDDAADAEAHDDADAKAGDGADAEAGDNAEAEAGDGAAHESGTRAGLSAPNLCVVRAPSSTGVRLRWWSMGLPLCARERGLALFHGTNYHIPVWDTCPTVVTIHDLSSLLHADTHRAEQVSRARRRLRAMARAATYVVTDSESVRREVCEHLGVDPSRVVSVPLAPRRAFRPASPQESARVRRRLGVEPDFLLFVGTVEPRKNLSALVRAYAELARAGANPPQLVIAGGSGWLNDDLFALIGREGIAPRTLFTGYVSDEDLRALYSSCLLSVYPSLYEGFGFPPLEAMSCGAAVVTSRIPVLEETCGRGAARLIDPLDFRALAQALAELLADATARAELSRAGRARAAEYTWERTALRTREVYAEAIRAWHGDARDDAQRDEARAAQAARVAAAEA